MNSTSSPEHRNVNLNNTAGITMDVGWNVSGAFTVAAGAGFNGSIYSHVFSGTFTNNGTVSSSGTLTFSPANATTLALGTNFSSTGSVVFGGTQPITISSTALSLGSVEIANTHAAGITPGSNWTLAGNLQIDGGTTFHAGAGFTHKLAGNLNNNGTFDGGMSVVVFNGNSLTAGSGSTVIYNLLVSSNLTLGADLTVTLNFTNNGVFDGIGGDLYFTGSSNSIIAGNATDTAINSIIVAKNSSTNAVTLALNVTNLTSLAIATGIFDTSAYIVSEDPVNFGALNVNASSTLRLGGTSSFPAFTGGYTLNAGSTVEYSGGAQTVLAVTNAYANLKLSGSGNKTLGSITTINGNVDISGTAKFNLSYNQSSSSPVGSLSYAGALQAQNTTYGSTTSTAANKTDTYFQGNGKLTVGSIVMDHFAITVSGTPTAKTPFNISITTQDANNNTVTAFTNLVNMTETGDGAGGTVSPTNSSYFSAGVLASQSVTLSKAGAAVTITLIGTNTPGTTTYTNISDPFTVIAATPDLSWATPTNLVYGTALGTNQNNATSSLAGTFAYNPTNGTVLPAGTNTLSVLFTPTDSNYSNRTATVQLVVTPAPLGITANNTNRTYGATNPVFTYAASGLVNGDTTGVLSGSPSLTTSATTNSPSGSYVITNTVGTLSATNYSFSFTNGTLTVNKALLNITASPTNRTYGAANPAFIYAPAGFVNGETSSVLSGAPALSTTATAASSVAGNPYSIAVTNGTLGAANYSFNFVSGQLTITPANSALAVSTSANPSPTGSNVTFTATVTAVSPGSGTTTGTIQFLADGAALGSPAILSGGIASVSTTSLSHGTHTISAQYAGDGNFLGSTNSLSPNQVINSSPVAATDYLQRHANSGAKIRVANLLTNDTDSDGDAVNFISAGATSANGSAVLLKGGWITYNPPVGFTNADSFNYVIADSGGLPATGLVSIAVVIDTEPCRNTGSIEDLGNGSVRIHFNGVPRRIYTIQYTDANTPDWQTLGPAMADASGKFDYTDSPASGSPARSYRSTQL